MVKKKGCLIAILIISFWTTVHAQAVRWRYASYSGAPNSVIYGKDGNIYAGGVSRVSSQPTDFTVISLTNTGRLRWAYRYNGPGIGSAAAYSMAIGSDGNIYASGYSTNSGTNLDFTVISLTDSGTERWIYKYNGPGNSDDCAYSIACGSDSNIYAAGYSSDAIKDFTVISLTNTGEERWVYRSPYESPSVIRRIIYGFDGNIYIGGDYRIISLTDNGSERWVYERTGVGSTYDLVYGSDGNIYATGNGWTASRGYYVTLSLTTVGGERWLNRRGAYDSTNAIGYSVRYGLDGNIYSTGSLYIDPYYENDIVVKSFTSNGVSRFEYIRPLVGGNDGGLSLAYGLDNNIYVTGIYGSYQWAVFSLTSTGQFNWEYLNIGWGAYSIVYGADSNLYVGCRSGWAFTVYSLTTNTDIAENTEHKYVPEPFKISTYFSNEIRIRNDKIAYSPFKLEIYNTQGALVFQKRFALSEPNINIGGCEIAVLSPGVYVLRFTTGETTTTHKIVKINSQ